MGSQKTKKTLEYRGKNDIRSKISMKDGNRFLKDNGWKEVKKCCSLQNVLNKDIGSQKDTKG